MLRLGPLGRQPALEVCSGDAVGEALGGAAGRAGAVVWLKPAAWRRAPAEDPNAA